MTLDSSSEENLLEAYKPLKRDIWPSEKKL
jgi:hypothetical protein